jgi:hypothetical protein
MTGLLRRRCGACASKQIQRDKAWRQYIDAINATLLKMKM